MGLLRENKDTLMTVLDPFIHDPLVEWEDERRKIVSSKKVGFNQIEIRALSRSDKLTSVRPITSLKSIYACSRSPL
jgi:serine/threonine-protein kinase ATR